MQNEATVISSTRPKSSCGLAAFAELHNAETNKNLNESTMLHQSSEHEKIMRAGLVSWQMENCQTNVCSASNSRSVHSYYENTTAQENLQHQIYLSPLKL